MGCDVYANKNEIACKAGGNKVIAEFPDVCLSPPSPPAGPIPVPYPNTSFSKDMKNGSKKVKIKGKEVMLKDKAFYKSSPLGDEAATRSFGANVITHSVTGKTYFTAWSMDVKFEGQNVDRHIDLTTSNHACPGGTGPLSTSLGDTARYDVRSVKDAARWARHVDPSKCKGKHKWECGKKACPDCWQPPCKLNAKKEQENYEAKQSGDVEQKVNAHKRANKEKIKKGWGEEGLKFENEALDKVKNDEKIEYIGYAAHCKICHMEGDLDIVTKNSVIECKKSPKKDDIRQMTEKIIPITKKCFKDKKIKIATRTEKLRQLKKKLSQPAWKDFKIEPIDP